MSHARADSDRELKGPDVSREVFGGILEYDGAGQYPGIELLNLVFCTESENLLPKEESVLVRRRAHDFARKLVWAEEQFETHPKKDEVLYDKASVESLRRLLECLQLKIPSSSKRPTWERSHFFPYTKSLVHWDARERRGKINNERRYLRGGGAFAYRILRSDTDVSRLDSIRSGFRELYEATGNSSLEQLASVLAGHGYTDAEAMKDDVASGRMVPLDDLETLYCDGVKNILGHYEVASVVRIRALIRWTAFWLILVQHVRAGEKTGTEESFLICDCAGHYPQLRRASQRCLKEKQSVIMNAIDLTVAELGGTLSNRRRSVIKGFFWASAATIGLLNAWRGRRHFTLSIGTIETLVMARTGPGSQVEFETFLHEHLFRSCRLVIGRSSAESAGLLDSIDASVFEDNEEHFARQMSAGGFLTEYSDATRMVGIVGV